jgi:hypothetical protein
MLLKELLERIMPDLGMVVSEHKSGYIDTCTNFEWHNLEDNEDENFVLCDSGEPHDILHEFDTNLPIEFVDGKTIKATNIYGESLELSFMTNMYIVLSQYNKGTK